MQSLLEQLTSDDPDLRAKAIAEADQAGEPEIAEELSGLVCRDDRADAERLAAAEALGRMPDTVAMPLLESLITDERPQVRTLAASGLGGQRHVGAQEVLLSALADDVNSVRNAAERSLLHMPAEVRSRSVDRLLVLLDHPTPLTRSPAARLLGLTGDRRALAPLVERLNQDEEWLMRMWAAKGLGDLGDLDAVEPLTQALLGDPRNRVRAAAAEAIGKLRPPNAEPLLRDALARDDDGGVRKMATEALQALGLADFEDDSFDDE